MISLKAYLRHLIKNKLYTLVTVVGFAISLTFVLLLSVYIKNELSVDDFHKNKDRIYRIESADTDFSGPIAVNLRDTYAEIQDFVRTYEYQGIITPKANQNFNMGYLAVDNSFFEVFSYPLIKGDPSKVLATKDQIVLSKSLALRLFGTEDPVGKEVTIDTRLKFTVSGVMEDFPENTHLKQQDAIINIQNMVDIFEYEGFLTDIGFCSMSIYFLEKPNADLRAKTSEVLKSFKKDFWLYQEGYANTLYFTPLKEIYFSDKVGPGTKSNSRTLVVVLSVIVLLILFLAIGNYVNLTIAQSTFRGREVAIKKLLGGSKKQLFLQFIKESIILCLIAVSLSLLFAKLVEPVFNSLLETKLHLNAQLTLGNLVLFSGVFIGIGFLSGLVPALRITSFKPIEVVKGTFRKKVKGVYGKAFITFQYTVTIALLACSWIIVKQTYFLTEKDLGFKKENIVWAPYLAGTQKKTAVKAELMKIPGVEQVSLVWGSPLDGGSNQSFVYKEKPQSFQEIRVDSAFFSMFDIKISPTDVAYSKEGVYFNQTALNSLGFESAPASFKMYERDEPIIGVVNDFNFKELRQNIGPLVIRQQNDSAYASKMFLKIKGNNQLATLNQVKTTYTRLIDNLPFDIRFVDDTIDQWYVKEVKTGKIIGYFTLLSFIISFIGILAMSTFYIQQRYKEIGIRKVNGASITQILALLSKDFIKWVALAFTIAVPISWYAMGKWLEGFAYRTTISWWIFVLAGLTALTIALLTVSWQSFRAAVANPVNALREE
ncbi:FtsX-like permease family protein [Flavobacteriaceae bacterium TP-CH-4]|uniref:FtsX-like permease family protein n=1 Tax=Pelagihabitans pacificus TaxID=2696054 RepID=A0A967AYH8_9FLAO|nr:ABC transporter permease [Pelagihabitans pacificus]NHF59922.1 FtsX-like permease family protein [Pelagihabitans pacificus]